MNRASRLSLAVAAALLAAPASALAAPTVTPVATGLDNPRGLTVAADGSVYVATAGRAGGKCLDPKKEQCYGFSGGVVRVDPATGAKQTVAKGLVSIGGLDGSFTSGPGAATVGADGSVYTVMTSAPREEVSGLPRGIRAQAGRVLKVAAGARTEVARIDVLEWRNNFDRAKGDRNTNPYGLVTLGDRHIVADAGANAVFEVRGSSVKLLAVMPKNGRAQSVPTSVAAGPDGAIYVGELAEGAGKDKARVLRIDPATSAVTTWASGFSAISGLAFGPDGSAYVTELTEDFRKMAPGDVTRIAPDGTRTSVGGGKLMFPAGAAVAADGSVYVSAFSILPGRTPKKGPFKGAGGQVVRISGL
jgi:sugar lactone lactonase YvrE